MICSSGIGFDPHCRGQRLTFGFHGIWQGTAVLYDKQTQSHWLHITGECIEGPLKGEVLKSIPGRHVMWSEWKRDHPDGELALADEKFAKEHFDKLSHRRGLTYFPPMFDRTIQSRDQRIPLTDLCFGVKSGSAAKAYPFNALEKLPDGLVDDVVGDVPIVIVFDKETFSTAGHGRTLDGKMLTFERNEEGLLRDKETGSLFDRDGFCTSGAFQGKRLPQIHGLQAEWYGWYATYPETEVFSPTK